MNRNHSIMFDTCIYVEISRGSIDSSLLRSKIFNFNIVVHGLVLLELYTGIRSKEELNFVKGLEDQHTLIPLSLSTICKGGLILNQIIQKENFDKRNLITFQNDVLIALSAKENNLNLLTINTKDFTTIKKYVDFKLSLF